MRFALLPAIALGLLLSPPTAIADAAAPSLRLSFDGILVGAGGETPAASVGPIAYEAGVDGLAARFGADARLRFDAAGNIDAQQGTIAFWIKPAWNGDDGLDHYVFGFGQGGGILVGKDAANNLRIMAAAGSPAGYPEQGAGMNVSQWRAGDWHHVAVTWSAYPGAVALFVDGREVERKLFDTGLPAIVDATFAIGNNGGAGLGSDADAALDNFAIWDAPLSADDILADMLGPAAGWSLEPLVLYPGQTWRPQTPATVRAEGLGALVLPLGGLAWTTTDASVVAEVSPGVFQNVAPDGGSAALEGRAGTAVLTLPVTAVAPVLPPADDPVDPFLAAPAEGHLYRMPVVVIRYLPTRDGVALDTAVTGDIAGVMDISLADMRARIDRILVRHKFMLEEGSRFRGYGSTADPPALGYEVVKIVTVYEDVPPGLPAPGSGNFPDYFAIFERFGASRWVNELGVKEIWICHYHNARLVPNESNMASPVTGDVSNSWRTTDMPVYGRTYVAYGINYGRTENEATHNHGHQLEAALGFVDGGLFWGQFVGPRGAFRAGDTHHPPNARWDYDYWNIAWASSDIADWSPAATGPFVEVNADTWAAVPYAWPAGDAPGPQDALREPHWYIYWMQSMPGWGNRVRWDKRAATNWWAFTADWDAAILSGMGLSAPANCRFKLSDRDLKAKPRGGRADLRVDAGKGCGWMASSNAPWIRVVRGRYDEGKGAVELEVAPNPGPERRTGTVAVANQLVTVVQGPAGK